MVIYPQTLSEFLTPYFTEWEAERQINQMLDKQITRAKQRQLSLRPGSSIPLERLLLRGESDAEDMLLTDTNRGTHVKAGYTYINGLDFGHERDQYVYQMPKFNEKASDARLDVLRERAEQGLPVADMEGIESDPRWLEAVSRFLAMMNVDTRQLAESIGLNPDNVVE